jgi:hypothetical protein
MNDDLRISLTLTLAKAKLNAAAAACISGQPGAAEEADQAKAEVDSLLALQRARGQRCGYPGCDTITIQTYCAKHRPQGDWQIAAEARDEQERERAKAKPA